MNLSFKHLSTRVTLAVLALVLGMAMAVVVLAERHQRENFLIEHQAEADENLQLYGAQFNQSVEVLRQDILFLSRTPPISGIIYAHRNKGIDPRNGDSMPYWKDRLQQIFIAFSDAHPNYFKIRYIGLADGGKEIVRIDRKNGQGIATAEDRLQRKADRDFFKAALKLADKKIFLSDIDLNQDWGRIDEPHVRTLRAVIPVYAPDGEQFGMVTVNMDVGNLLDAIPERKSSLIRSYMTNQRGDYLVHPDPKQTFGFDLGHKRLIQQDLPSLAALYESDATDHWSLRPMQTPTGIQHIAVERIRYDPSRSENFIVLAYAMPESVVEKQLEPERHLTVLIALGATLLALGLTLLIARHMFLPLHKLTEAAHAIAEGSYDAKLPKLEGGEIGDLTEAFKMMQDRVRARERDYQNLNRALEQRVKERTAELEARQADLSLAASVFHNTEEGITVTDVNSVILSVNPAFTAITGYSAEEAIGRTPRILRSDHHGPEFYRSLWDILLRDGRWQGEIWNRRKDGEAFLEWLTISQIVGPDGKAIRYVAVFSDITEMHRKDEHIRHQAFHDALTGLPNRALLLDRLEHGIESARREQSHLAVMFVDLDHFKAVNDNFGHDTGDALLQEVSHRLSGCVRSADTVARMGGDEFVILLEQVEQVEDCAALAKKIIATLSEVMPLRGHDVQIGASIGIALFPDDGADVATMIKHADAAMYLAKSAGRGNYRFFKPA